jgi:hypothetical protein
MQMKPFHFVYWDDLMETIHGRVTIEAYEAHYAKEAAELHFLNTVCGGPHSMAHEFSLVVQVPTPESDVPDHYKREFCAIKPQPKSLARR